jgi:hypothetical protein
MCDPLLLSFPRTAVMDSLSGGSRKSSDAAGASDWQRTTPPSGRATSMFPCASTDRVWGYWHLCGHLSARWRTRAHTRFLCMVCLAGDARFFPFCGQAGAFYRLSQRPHVTRWSAYRTMHRHDYQHYLGTTDHLTIDCLEQMAAKLQSYMASL